MTRVSTSMGGMQQTDSRGITHLALCAEVCIPIAEPSLAWLVTLVKDVPIPKTSPIPGGLGAGEVRHAAPPAFAEGPGVVGEAQGPAQSGALGPDVPQSSLVDVTGRGVVEVVRT